MVQLSLSLEEIDIGIVVVVVVLFQPASLCSHMFQNVPIQKIKKGSNLFQDVPIPVWNILEPPEISRP